MASSTFSTASLRLSAIGIAVATASAAAIGSSAQATAAPADVPFRAYAVNGKSVQFEIGRGSVAVEQGILTFRNTAGATVGTQELKYYRDGRAYPIAATITGRTATLTPVTDVAKSTKVAPSQLPGAHSVRWKIDGPQTRQERDDQALQQFITDLGAAMTVSSIVGMVIGAVLGCAIGFVLGAGVGCIPVALVGLSVGSILGSMVGGGGGLLAVGQKYMDTINKPFKPQYKWVPDKKSGKKAPPTKKKN
jgi:hypothetical protein